MWCIQDDAYLASLQADQEKELKAKEEAEAHRLQEQMARETALEEERRREEESRRKLEEQQVMLIVNFVLYLINTKICPVSGVWNCSSNISLY